ncbi:MAG: NAD(P)H-dependent oxidoreductase subunit E [Dehalococcoidia bacterium]|nr:NAD(P)H-dependent oxidoreductase subunit E [Dehalococcoidia bacterium]
MPTVEISRIDQIINKYEGEEGILIQLLLDMQQELNWIPREVAERISQRLNIPLSQIYRVASFYTAMSLTPRGRHVVSVCMGTACHVRGSPRLLDRITDILKIQPGETSADGRFTLKTVNCLGCCALGPVMEVDGKYHGKMVPAKAGDVLKNYD